MKKLILILFLIPFSLSAQIELSESYTFTPDKGRHMVGGAISSVTVFTLTYRKTNNPNLAFRAGWMASAFIAIGKEGFDFMNSNQVSLADAGYTIVVGVLSAWICKKIATRKRSTIQERLIAEDPEFTLDNPIFKIK